MNTTAICSMLHEDATTNSATRIFRRQPVLSWTLRRLGLCATPLALAILCWEDQLAAVAPIAEEAGASVLVKGPRQTLPMIEKVRIARRWANGWRGGLHSSCDFDLGFHGKWLTEIAEANDCDAVVLIDPAAGLVDAKTISALVDRLESNDLLELAFAQAPPGLGGVALRLDLLKRLATNNCHPGKTLHYMPDQPMFDPIGSESCVALPTSVTRCPLNFRLDSRRQIERITAAAVELNGHLLGSDSEDIVNRLKWARPLDESPREITIELTTRRNTKPIFAANGLAEVQRPDLTIDAVKAAIDSAGGADDLRVTFGGVGDPLCSAIVIEAIEIAAAAGASVCVETDLLPSDPTVIDQLAKSSVEIVSLHLPAMSPQTYAAVMGVDAFKQAVDNLKRLFEVSAANKRGGPIIVPIFVKTAANLGEMETWYDHWLKTLGSAVVRGPSDFAGKIKDVAVADMTPTVRRPCRRIGSRLTVLSSGQVVPCEQDICGQQAFGHVATANLATVWNQQMTQLRSAHASGHVGELPVCSKCREWHRP